MSLDFKLILDEFNRRFDELEIRWDRRFSSAAYIDLPPTSLSINHSSNASTSAPPTPVAVIADNWGGCFDDGEQHHTRPSVVVDNWGGFFCGEDVAPLDNPTRFVLPVASTDEASIDTAPARANSGVVDDSVFVTAEPSGYDKMDARLDLRFARLQQAEEVDEPYRDTVSPLPSLPVVYELYREASHPPLVHDNVAGVVSTGLDDDLNLQQIAKEPSVSSPPRHSSRDVVRGPCPRPLHHQLTIPVKANLDQICRLSRPCDVADRGLLCDLLWSDPSSMEDREWADNKDRYVSCTFGADARRTAAARRTWTSFAERTRWWRTNTSSLSTASSSPSSLPPTTASSAAPSPSSSRRRTETAARPSGVRQNVWSTPPALQ
jgi:hypothetical protein